MAVGVGHALQAAVAVLVGVLDERLALTLDADGCKVMELVVGKGILHTVTANDLGHVIEGVVSVGDVCKRGACCILARYLGGSTRLVVLVGRLVAKAVGHLVVARGVTVHRVGGLITASVGFLDEVVACIVTVHLAVVGVVAERAIDRAKFTVVDIEKLRTSK